MARFHHRLGREYPDLIGAGDVAAGDLRLVRQGWGRLRVRAEAIIRRRPDLLR
jgi:hypothetical protein